MIATADIVDAIAATMSPTDAARHPWQAVVVGAGPAGTATAWRLATAGIRTLILDRHGFPRTKICGCCLSTRALAELRGLGSAAMPAAAVPLEAVRLMHRGRCVRVPLPGGRVVSREALDAHLLRRAISAGCHWLPGMQVSALDEPDGTSAVDVRAAGASAGEPRPHVFRAEIVVLASGLVDLARIGQGGLSAAPVDRRSDPRSRIGLGAILASSAADLPAGELVMAVGREGYCGIVRLEDGRLDVAAAFDRAALQPDPARAVARLLDGAAPGTRDDVPALDAVGGAAFRATPPLTRRAAPVAGARRRIYRVGDAGGYVEPFTGEGIGWALVSGRLLADALIVARGLRPPADVAERYVAARRREITSAHARCRAVATGLRRPTAVAAAMAAARALPWAARRVAPLVIGATSPGDDP